MTNIEDLLDAFTEYSQAVADEKEARKTADPYSWDYFGHSYHKRIDEAKTNAEKLLNELIDGKINKALVDIIVAKSKSENSRSIF